LRRAITPPLVLLLGLQHRLRRKLGTRLISTKLLAAPILA
jgi:hypothetical protein